MKQNQPKPVRKKTADYIIDGEEFDHYSPITNSVRYIYFHVIQKVIKGQTKNIVINLSDAPSVQVPDLLTQFKNWPHLGLDKIIIIDQSGQVFKNK